MLISVEKMMLGEQLPLAYAASVPVPKAYGLTDETVPISVRGTLLKETTSFLFQGSLVAAVHAECGLCLAPLEQTLTVPLYERFSETPTMPETEEIRKMDAKQIDLSAVTLEALLMAIPFRFVCSPDCKGLCPKCGADRNKTRCLCTADEPDNQFTKLKALFKEV